MSSRRKPHKTPIHIRGKGVSIGPFGRYYPEAPEYGSTVKKSSVGRAFVLAHDAISKSENNMKCAAGLLRERASYFREFGDQDAVDALRIAAFIVGFYARRLANLEDRSSQSDKGDSPLLSRSTMATG